MAKRKPDTEAEATKPEPEMPEVSGIGVHPVKGGYIAVRVTNRGSVEAITPKRKGEVVGESLYSAFMRARDAQEREVLGGLRGRK